MTPRLRLTFRCLRLPAVLTAATLPWYGIAVVHGSPPAYAAEPGPAPASAPSHGEGRQGPARDAPPGRSVPKLQPLGHSAGSHSAEAHSAGAHPHDRHPDADHRAPEQERPDRDDEERGEGRDHPGQDHPGRDRPGRGPSASAGPARKDSATPVPMPSDSASASASVHPYRSLAWTEPTRAGSRAGEGRMRPGRPDRPATEPEDEDDSATATPAVQPAEPETTDVPAASEEPAREAGPGSTPPAPRPGTRQASRQSEAVTEPGLRILPLGSGLVLIGLGLGLALLGLRLRRS
ncbi:MULTISPECIES: hypothetical protein [Streptomyces]|uniref:hypothetical protein n=1 Tax=Streptomyces TaxID=1883 RepID=UPI00167995F6|nr:MULTISPECIES: hypothetical protein [Streptomyces]MBK3526359.1 hypothetical protein [Streptomyces sp. MBT70]GGR67765.1 hypothetical protein GCM10010236_22200 [Streptomyces eurythermus]